MLIHDALRRYKLEGIGLAGISVTEIGLNVGFGCDSFELAVYIGNQPNMQEYHHLDTLQPLASGEVHAIGQACGNGWRKVFNVYAKLLFALDLQHFSFCKGYNTWQQYRDALLLQKDSKTALLFSAPIFQQDNTLHIIMGRTYAKQLLASGQLQAQLHWLDEEFAIDTEQRLIVCPYFDYRQLSNVKIERLAAMLRG